MAVKNINNYTNNQGFGLPLNIRRGNPNPLDNSEIWKDLASAENYAKNDAVAYVGQIISYFKNDGTVKAVQIADEDGRLQDLGSSGAGGIGGDSKFSAYYHTSEEWANHDIVMDAGGLGIDSTNGYMKIGDGVHKWSELDFALFPVSLSQRGDNLLLKEDNQSLFLSEALMKKLILSVIEQYHSEEDIHEFVTADGYTFITADSLMFIDRG